MFRNYLLYSVLTLLLVLPLAQAEETNPFLVGEFKVTRVVDGDTIAVDGLPETIRFLCIDTEECEKGPGAEQRTAAFARDYLSYVQEQTRSDPMAKFSTPMGWEARKFAEARSPETFRRLATEAGLPSFEVIGEGGLTADDPNTGIGIWLRFTKEAASDS